MSFNQLDNSNALHICKGLLFTHKENKIMNLAGKSMELKK